MSEVRRGEDTLLERPIAVKLLLDYGDPRSVARFQQEAQILARLHHPNVISVFDTGVDGGDRFIVMELVEGPTLRELLDTEGPLAPERAGEIASRLASALGFAHGKAVIHRDVKPSNVLLPPDGGVKLADMGIARLLSPEALTATLSVRGTACTSRRSRCEVTVSTLERTCTPWAVCCSRCSPAGRRSRETLRHSRMRIPTPRRLVFARSTPLFRPRWTNSSPRCSRRIPPSARRPERRSRGLLPPP